MTETLKVNSAKCQATLKVTYALTPLSSTIKFSYLPSYNY